MADLVGPRVYSCCNCRNHVSLHDDIISKAFHGRNGRAFLFSHAMNIVMGRKEDRQLLTGLHTVADIYCRDCREVLGWKYERAYDEAQRYKEDSLQLYIWFYLFAYVLASMSIARVWSRRLISFVNNLKTVGIY